jgi:hemerythrin-like domain-containing protein
MNQVSNPADILIEEHRAVLGKLESMEKAIKDLKNREGIRKDLEGLMAFFASEFWVHFDKEEKALFPEFSGFMPRGVGPLAAMLDEHELIRNTNDTLQEAVKAYLAGDDSPEVCKTITDYGQHFIEFLRGHIQKEDGLFPRMAELHLTPKQNEKVVQLFGEMQSTYLSSHSGPDK